LDQKVLSFFKKYIGENKNTDDLNKLNYINQLKDYINTFVDQKERTNKEIKKLVDEINNMIKDLSVVHSINSKNFEKIFVKNTDGRLITVNIAKEFMEKFNVTTEK
jgi:hypothetical protein